MEVRKEAVKRAVLPCFYGFKVVYILYLMSFVATCTSADDANVFVPDSMQHYLLAEVHVVPSICVFF